jgi:superfamily II DNA or RNA helicase
MRPVLREYQHSAINGLRQGFASGLLRQVLVAPTGAGKSVMGHDIIASACQRKRRVLFAVNRVQLVQQFSERLTRAGIEHGIMRGADSRREYLPVIVGSIQTIARRGLPDAFDVIVIDEAHAVPGSKDYLSVIKSNPKAVVLGLTATPWSRGMGRYDPDLEGELFQGAVVAAHYSQLIAEGHLVDCDVYAPAEIDLSGVRTQRNQFGEIDYVESELGKAVNKPKLVGDIVEHWKRLANGTPTVVFASSIAHSQAIVEEFTRAGVTARHIDAYCDHDERKAILASVDSGKTTVISCAALLAEGWDQPSIRTMILARPTKSMIRYVQMAGRVLRPFPGKDKALILDHSGTVLKLGFPTDDRDYELDDGKPRTTEGGESQEADEPKAVRCPECGFVDPHGKNPCERCGHKRVRKHKEEVGDGELKKMEKTPKPTMMDKQKFYSELLFIQRKRGFKPGWVARQYRERFDVWPKGMQDYPIEPSPETNRWITSQMIRYSKRQKAA